MGANLPLQERHRYKKGHDEGHVDGFVRGMHCSTQAETEKVKAEMKIPDRIAKNEFAKRGYELAFPCGVVCGFDEVCRSHGLTHDDILKEFNQQAFPVPPAIEEAFPC